MQPAEFLTGFWWRRKREAPPLVQVIEEQAEQNRQLTVRRSWQPGGGQIMMGYSYQWCHFLQEHSWNVNQGRTGWKTDFTKCLFYLENAALPDAKCIPQKVKVGTSDLHVLDTAHICPGHHLSPIKQTDKSKRGRQVGTRPLCPLPKYLPDWSGGRKSSNVNWIQVWAIKVGCHPGSLCL